MSRERIRGPLKQAVIDRANACCEYCAGMARYSMSPFAVEHITPLSRGGKNELDNLALSCQGCNGAKYNKTAATDPISLQAVPLFHPRQHSWQEHFAWNDDCTEIIGLTPTGRATVETLHLNREELLNLRRVLYAIGEHPPKNYLARQGDSDAGG